MDGAAMKLGAALLHLTFVTSPAVSWAVVRHTYVVRVSCIISSSLTRPDVMDINLNNVLSFGFGANAGLGPSCLSKNKTASTLLREGEIALTETSSGMVTAVRSVGWIVMVTDLIFLASSVHLLIKLFNGPDLKATKIFMIVAVVTMLLSFIYCMFYVAACMRLGGIFPVIEFVFAFVDLFKWTVWIHFLLVIRTYSKSYRPMAESRYSRWIKPWMNLSILKWLGWGTRVGRRNI